MARTPLGDSDACVLVENDLKGLTGLPRNIVHVALRPLHAEQRIYAIGQNLAGAYGGIDAGVVTCGKAVVDELARLSAAVAAGSTVPATLAAALNKFAQGGTLRMQPTGGKM